MSHIKMHCAEVYPILKDPNLRHKCPTLLFDFNHTLNIPLNIEIPAVKEKKKIIVRWQQAESVV